MSKRMILSLVIILSSVVCINSTFAQNYSKDKCLGLALKLENEIGLLSPTDEINNSLFNTCIGIRKLLINGGGHPVNWYVVGPLIEKITGIVKDAQRGKCSGADCKRAQEYRNKIDEEF